MAVQPHTSRKPWLACTGILALLMLTAATTLMASVEDANRDPRRAHLQERLREARARVLRKHGIDLERRSGKDRWLELLHLRRLGRDLDAVRQQTLEKLSGTLTDSQIEEYGKIQQELRQAMRKRLRQRW